MNFSNAELDPRSGRWYVLRVPFEQRKVAMTKKQAMQRVREAFQEVGHALSLTQDSNLEELMRAGVSLFDLFRVWQILFGPACRDDGRRLLLSDILARRSAAFRAESSLTVGDIANLVVSTYR